MSPNRRIRGGKIVAVDNLYTALLGIALCIIVATAAFVAYQCYFQYDTIFKIQ
jgi:hypothetical protein